ncbi:MAG: hypothetical protein FD149_1924 [Rhodospirillaceae bacterium]|nr:MAG: hypothetical protein FD149_1924 [Rhodospirillaceae bacterium]
MTAYHKSWGTFLLTWGLVLGSGGTAPAQQGGAVPPLTQDIIAPPPVRKVEMMSRDSTPKNPAAPQQTEALIARFHAAYATRKRPRLALYWNRALAETLDEWYGTERMVVTGQGTRSGGPHPPMQRGQDTTVFEHQRRLPGAPSSRPQAGETWAWEFEDGFQKPFLDAGAVLVDRVAINRLTGAEGASTPGGGDVDIKALRQMADYMVEILYVGSGRSTIGYELHARVLETRTGQILANVNSRNMAGWGPPRERYEVGPEGFRDLEEENEERVGPVEERQHYKAGPHGFKRHKKPPKPYHVANRLAYNVMKALADAWEIR